MENTNNVEIFFAKINPDATIPSKRDEDVGFDIYANFETEQIIIHPQTTILVPTGIASAFDPSYGIILKERSSLGSKGIALRCGVIDSGYRGEWKIALTNTTKKPFIITKNLEYKNKDAIVYPITKALVQAILVPVPKTKTSEISYDKLKNISSERGTGGFGSTNK